MSFGFDTGEAIPNADVPRLREYAKIMTRVSDLVEVLEVSKTKTDLESDFTIDIEKSPNIIIPDAITDAVGEVSYISAKLKLATDIVHEDEDIAPDYEVMPTIEMFYDSGFDSSIIPEGDKVERQASNISLDFYGSKGVFMVSRTNLTESDDAIRDHVILYGVDSNDPQPVNSISDQALNHFLVSAVNPLAVDEYSQKQFDLTAPATFPALNALFSLAGRHQSSDSVRHLPGVESYFKHRQEYDPQSERFKTSFQIRFQSDEEPHHTIFAIHSLETNFQLSFKTIRDTGDFTPNNYEENVNEDVAIRVPYTPTLTELSQLSEILGTQVAILGGATEKSDRSFDLDEKLESDELFEPIEQRYEFDKITTEETRRQFAAMADIAITQELEQILDDQPEDDSHT